MKIAIAGYGVEGKASYEYWSRDGQNELTIVDGSENIRAVAPAGASILSGEDAFQRLDGFDMVIRTPSLAPTKIKTDGKVWSATNEFFEKCPAPIIGVTGSKGKGTTSSLIASILRAAGKTVHLVGNIGVTALHELEAITPNDIVVYELSSFQLWDIERSPHTAVVLLIEREHLDVHSSMEDYVSAKANIARHQTERDVLIYNSQNKYTSSIAELSKATKVGFPSDQTAHVADGFFWNGEQKLCSVDSLKLPGEHNIQNALAAIDAVWEYVQDSTAISSGLAAFHGLEHRLQVVGQTDGVTYVDDSIATTPASAIAGLRAFKGKKAIILGGSSKGSDFSELATEMTRHDVDALLIGEEAQKIAAAFDTAGFKRYQQLDFTSMDDLVEHATRTLAGPGTVLLSPSAASFGLFKNYVDRGDQFVAAVKKRQPAS